MDANQQSPGITSNFLDFYRFLGVHSLLIGLFPFFIPVYLWTAGYSLVAISSFIAISGAAFCLSLRSWELAALKFDLSILFSITFVLELLLLSIIFILEDTNATVTRSYLTHFDWPLTLLALGNGVYNCFFWTTQRSLFVGLVNKQNSGRNYGNFQIFVMVFLKGGILAGGLLLQHLGYSWVFAVSALTVLAALVYCLSANPLKRKLPAHHPINLSHTIQFRDRYGSKAIFLIDGLFLFLESHFWTLSLFFLAGQNYAHLGGVVIFLAIVFSILFYLAKNTIDRLLSARVYQYAVGAYVLSWWLRPQVETGQDAEKMIVLLLCITFLSSFFRLTFNKRFYDMANLHDAREYLVIKSYYTQAAVIVIFGAIAVFLLMTTSPAGVVINTTGSDVSIYAKETLDVIYLVSGVFALFYLLYKHK